MTSNRLKALLLVVLMLPCIQGYGKEIHREKSLYRNIVVKEKLGMRCLVFAVKRGDRNQTCMNLKHPERLVFPYVRMSFAGLLLNAKPKDILIVGLGGGSIPLTLAALYPDSNIDVVEIDEAVVKVARRFFNFKETSRLNVHVVDARVFIKRAALKKRQYDMVILDAFTGEYIPEHLMTQEFLEETRSLLTNKGVLVANTFSSSKLYDHESVTYHKVFGDFLNFKMANTGNRVILAAKSGLPGEFILKSRAKQLSARLHNYAIDIDNFPKHLSRKIDWDQNTRLLTDQYNPANLLQGEGH